MLIFPQSGRARVLPIGLILSVLGTVSSCSQGQEREPEIYLLPEGYTGSVYIIHGIPGGQPQQYQNGARILAIPPGGLLLIQSDPNYGGLESESIQFFYQHQDGSRTQIAKNSASTIHDTPENRRDTRPVVHGGDWVFSRPTQAARLSTLASWLVPKRISSIARDFSASIVRRGSAESTKMSSLKPVAIELGGRVTSGIFRRRAVSRRPCGV